MATSSESGRNVSSGGAQDGEDRPKRPPSAEKDSHNHPLNLDAADFDCETYLSHLIKKKSLQKLLEVEDTMVHEVSRPAIEARPRFSPIFHYFNVKYWLLLSGSVGV